ncbi:hypothetical protein FRB99_006777 [Tulasnella sp. 403]|nr:hypothetical protein FRB99_006777 [Tulasnella sp. 403]
MASDDLESLYITIPFQPPEYSPVSPLSDVASSFDSPDYSRRPHANEISLDGTPIPPTSPSSPTTPYTYCHKSLSLNLLCPTRTTQSPAFGRNGLIQGFFQMEGSLKHVDRIELDIKGVVTATALDSGSPASISSRTVLSHLQTMYSAQTQLISPVSTSPRHVRYPISFRLPTTAEDSGDDLPPSFYRRLPKAEASVRYTIRVSVFKRGLLRRNERVETVFLYLPKTSPPLPVSGSDSDPTGPGGPSRSPLSRNPAPPNEWKVISLLGRLKVPDLEVQLRLPEPLVYQARTSIPFMLVASYSSPILADLVLSHSRVTLVKHITVQINDKIFEAQETLGEATLGKPTSSLSPAADGTFSRTLHGCVAGGREQGELSWRVPEMVAVKHLFRLEVKPDNSLTDAIPSFVWDEVIELTTHATEDAYNFDGTMDGPALGVIGRL